MKYYKHVDNGYIQYVSADNGNAEITEAEYNAIMAAIRSAPVPPQGYAVRLRTDLTWETYALPEEPIEAEATEEDYQAALCEMGVDLSDEREA